MDLSEPTRPGIHRTVILFIITFLSACVVTPVSDNFGSGESIYTPGQLREDLRFLDKSLRKIHPEPFSRLDLSIYQSTFQQLHQNLIWPLRRQDFYRQMAPLLSRFADTHTRLIYPQQEYLAFIKQYGKFPLALLYSKEGLIVVADEQEKMIVPIGAELLAINDIAIESMLENFKSYIPAETDTGQRKMIQIEFPRLLWSLYDIRKGYVVDYFWQGKVFRKRLVPNRQVIQHEQEPVASHYGSFSIDDQTSLIWLNDFNEQGEIFKQFLYQQFKHISDQNVKTLIVDLRYNNGGITDNLATLLSYLTNRRIQWATQGAIKLSEPFRDHHSHLLSNAKSEKYGNYLGWLPVEYLSLLQWEIFFTSDGKWLESEIKPVYPNREYVFQGKLYVLSNGYCFSACATMVATLQKNKLATIIGESPGSQTHVQYGYPIEVELPNTGLKLVIPAMRFALTEDTKNQQRVITPDYELERSKYDVILGQDTVLDFAVALSKNTDL